MGISPSQHHIDFIHERMDAFAQYDAMRPKDHTYEFHHHSKRVAENMSLLAKACGYDDDMGQTLYWATLPHDIGKMALPVEIWDLPDKPTEDQRRERRSHTWRGVDMVRDAFGDECDRDPFLILLTDIMTNHHETMDGTGFQGLTGDHLSTEVRMACICDAFDGWSVARPHFNGRDISPAAVVLRMKTEKNGHFDPQLLETFESIVIKE